MKRFVLIVDEPRTYADICEQLRSAISQIESHPYGSPTPVVGDSGASYTTGAIRTMSWEIENTVVDALDAVLDALNVPHPTNDE